MEKRISYLHLIDSPIRRDYHAGTIFKRYATTCAVEGAMGVIFTPRHHVSGDLLMAGRKRATSHEEVAVRTAKPTRRAQQPVHGPKSKPGIEEMAHMQEPTLIVLRNGIPIFTSHGKWLHPLFELEAYLNDHSISPNDLVLQDKIIGKAAALLIHRLGFRTVTTGILSRLGEAVLQRR